MPESAYHKADEKMREEIAREESFLNSWTFNIKEEVHTGWPVDILAQSILDTDAHLLALQKMKPVLKYPASSMWTQFSGIAWFDPHR